jgi:hypothetical protein
MNKAEAQALVGQKVTGWSPTWGVYAGTLVEVLPRRPWRGKVRIEAVLAYPCQIGEGLGRLPFKEGDIKEFGHSSIDRIPPELVAQASLSYGDSLRPALEETIAAMERQIAWAKPLDRPHGLELAALAILKKHRETLGETHV